MKTPPHSGVWGQISQVAQEAKCPIGWFLSLLRFDSYLVGISHFPDPGGWSWSWRSLLLARSLSLVSCPTTVTCSYCCLDATNNIIAKIQIPTCIAIYSYPHEHGTQATAGAGK